MKLVTALENKEQLIRFRVYGKSVRGMQTDRQRDRYDLMLTFPRSQSTIETLEKDGKYVQLRRSGVFIVNTEHFHTFS